MFNQAVPGEEAIGSDYTVKYYNRSIIVISKLIPKGFGDNKFTLAEAQSSQREKPKT